MLNTWWQSLRARLGLGPREIPERLWRDTLSQLPFIAALPDAPRQRLRRLAGLFLAQKEFHGAHGLQVTDAMAVSIAAQACLPLTYMPGGDRVMRWYGDFVTVVVHPAQAVARRKVLDAAGVEHHYAETLLGEAMQGGPVMLSWHHVAHAGTSAESGHNLVIHEFAHKLDMHGKAPGQSPDGCPELPPGFMGLAPAPAQRLWRDTLQESYRRFHEQVMMAERFGAEFPWLDRYGATAPSEFFAVACEAYWVQRERFGQEFAELRALFDGFFGTADARIG